MRTTNKSDREKKEERRQTFTLLEPPWLHDFSLTVWTWTFVLVRLITRQSTTLISNSVCHPTIKASTILEPGQGRHELYISLLFVEHLVCTISLSDDENAQLCDGQCNFNPVSSLTCENARHTMSVFRFHRVVVSLLLRSAYRSQKGANNYANGERLLWLYPQ